MPPRVRRDTTSRAPPADLFVPGSAAGPAQLAAFAHTQGNQAYPGPGQKHHLPHEAWHVVRRKPAPVKPVAESDHGVLPDQKACRDTASPGQTPVTQLSESAPSNTAPAVVQRVIFDKNDEDYPEKARAASMKFLNGRSGAEKRRAMELHKESKKYSEQQVLDILDRESSGSSSLGLNSRSYSTQNDTSREKNNTTTSSSQTRQRGRKRKKTDIADNAKANLPQNIEDIDNDDDSTKNIEEEGSEKKQRRANEEGSSSSSLDEEIVSSQADLLAAVEELISEGEIAIQEIEAGEIFYHASDIKPGEAQAEIDAEGNLQGFLEKDRSLWMSSKEDAGKYLTRTGIIVECLIERPLYLIDFSNKNTVNKISQEIFKREYDGSADIQETRAAFEYKFKLRGDPKTSTGHGSDNSIDKIVLSWCGMLEDIDGYTLIMKDDREYALATANDAVSFGGRYRPI